MNEQTRAVPEEKFEVELVDDKTQNDFSIKVLVIGDVEVGKTTIFNQFTKHEFYPSYSPTTGYNFFFVKLKTNNKKYDEKFKEIFRCLCYLYDW